MARRWRAAWLLYRPWPQAVVGALVAGYIRLVHHSGRWELVCDPATAALVQARRPFIGAFWHGRMLLIEPAWRTLVRELGVADAPRTHVLSSAHGDGRLMARATARFGAGTVFGETKRGATGLLRGARRVIEDGEIVAITPDGPRGPRMRAKTGAVRLAMATGVPIVPVAVAARRQRPLRSWDRFMLVPPFTRGRFACGAPLEVAAGSEPEAARLALEERLNALTTETDRALGLIPVEPAG
jgi:lysophospholipid acyltransferase (LPLAT)-like uncharacterized protein